MKPEDVNPKNFTLKKIIYQDAHFSIAEGIWVDDGTNRRPMICNGDTKNPEDAG